MVLFPLVFQDYFYCLKVATTEREACGSLWITGTLLMERHEAAGFQILVFSVSSSTNKIPFTFILLR